MSSAKAFTPDTAADLRYRRAADHRSRVQRWRDAVAVLIALQAEYRAWLQALPDNLQESATAQALQAIDELDLAELAAIEPPRDFGRDGCTGELVDRWVLHEPSAPTPAR